MIQNHTKSRELSLAKSTRLHHRENAKHFTASFASELAHEHNDPIGWETWLVCGSELAGFLKESEKKRKGKANEAGKKEGSIYSIMLCGCCRRVLDMYGYAPPMYRPARRSSAVELLV